MAEIGLDLDKRNLPPVTELVELGSQWARWTFDLEYLPAHVAYSRECNAEGIKVLITFDGDSYRAYGDINDPGTWIDTHTAARDALSGYIDAINPCNEPDGSEESSTQLSLNTVNGQIWTARDVWGPGATIVGVGSVSGAWSYYQGVRRDLLSGLDAHLYAKFSPEALAVAIAQHQVLGLPIWMSEIGVSSDQFGEEAQAGFLEDVLSYVRDRQDIVMCCWFAYQPYGGWGLIREDGSRKPAWYAFQRVTGGGRVIPENPIYQFDFKRWHDMDPQLIGDPVTNEISVWEGQQMQHTTHGWLIWTQPNKLVFACEYRDEVWRWDASERSPERVA